MIVDSAEINEKIKEIADLYILPRYKTLQQHEIISKTGKHNLVTAADLETEQALKDYLLQKYPGCTVLGEESVSAGTADISDLSSSDGMIWVIDPVDGTFNFVHGKRDFAVMLACLIDGVTHYGWIYDVLEGQFVYAEKGEGAWYKGKRAKVSTPESVRSATGHINEKYFPDFARAHIRKYAKVVKRYYSLGCTAREYLKVATGASDFAIYCRAKPWDHLAGTLMVAEAGGIVRRWDEQPYQAGDYKCGLIVACNEHIWHNLHDFYIQPIMLEQLKRIDL